MPIIPTVGRRGLKTRSLIVAVYVVLILGSITTVYPFIIMLATSVSSHTDFEQYRLLPRYLYNDKALMSKYLEEKNKRHLFDYFKLRYKLEEPRVEVVNGIRRIRRFGRFVEMESLFKEFDLEAPAFKTRLDDWLEFKRDLPMKYKDTFFHSLTFPVGDTQVGFQQFLKAKYPTIEAMRALAERPKSYVIVTPPYEAFERHAWYPAKDLKSQEWADFRATLPATFYNPVTVRDIYQEFISDRYSLIEDVNDAFGTSYEYFWQIPFPKTKPDDATAEMWEEFVRRYMPMRFARLDVELCEPSYREYIRKRYATVQKYNAMVGDSAASLEEVALSPEMPESTLALTNWQDYYEDEAPIEAIILDNADIRYARFLAGKYASIDELNDAYGTSFASFDAADPPYQEEDYWDATTRKRDIKRRFLTRNYVFVTKRVFLQGRPLFNTFILVVLTVFTHVTVNPLAAYALSRYRLKYSAKVLIFMLATMAFPAQVAMIPNFLMIKELGLLNTFPALILPGLASGYYVFLLKGFFDSLPSELYEAASIDGASELRMFWTITLPLSLPVLSVIALFSFGGAYGSFIWAFTTCQDPKMWTLMVFLHQFQIEANSAPYLVMASLVLAAIPTMVVFLSAQKVLMKGIVVPTMK